MSRHPRYLVAADAYTSDRPALDDSLPIYALFARQAALRPTATAVRCRMERLSYAELHQQVLALCAILERRGIGAGQVVGIYLDRGPALLAAALAIVRTGAAFLLLDSTTPRERLARIVQQSGMRYAVMRRETGGLPGACAVERVHIEDSENGDASPSAAASLAPDDSCYLMFTSGSTGVPKGVQLTHRGLSNVIQALARDIGLNESDNVLMLSSVGFDISLLELFMPLVCGAALTIVPQEHLGNITAIRTIVESEAVTVVQATPSTWRLLTSGEWRLRCRLKILCGGEVLPPNLLAPLLQIGEQIWHLYGPTETTIWSLVQVIDRADTPIRLGKPIGQTQIRVLDARHKPVAAGEAGELYIGGAGVAAGYLSGEQHGFVTLGPDGSRFFRTGDRVRCGGNGLEFLGRADRQVKIRGHRIELDEVESLLRAHPLVAAAAVTGQLADGVCTATLAYVVLKNPCGGLPAGFADLALPDIKRWLTSQLPQAALPCQYLLLDMLPLTPNGKLDYAALPAFAPALSAGETDAPANGIEHKLVSLWKVVLNLDSIGRHADFFTIGGQSLLAAMLAFKVQQEFGIDFSITTVIENSSVQSMAARIAETSKTASNR